VHRRHACPHARQAGQEGVVQEARVQGHLWRRQQPRHP
ncbi:hypothetical protein BN1708_019807, partial [Verticillium longisporum]